MCCHLWISTSTTILRQWFNILHSESIMMVCVWCVCMLSQFQDQWFLSGLESKLVLSLCCAHLGYQVGLKWRVLCLCMVSFSEDVPLVEFMYVALACQLGGAVGDSGLCHALLIFFKCWLTPFSCWFSNNNKQQQHHPTTATKQNKETCSRSHSVSDSNEGCWNIQCVICLLLLKYTVCDVFVAVAFFSLILCHVGSSLRLCWGSWRPSAAIWQTTGQAERWWPWINHRERTQAVQ